MLFRGLGFKSAADRGIYTRLLGAVIIRVKNQGYKSIFQVIASVIIPFLQLNIPLTAEGRPSLQLSGQYHRKGFRI